MRPEQKKEFLEEVKSNISNSPTPVKMGWKRNRFVRWFVGGGTTVSIIKICAVFGTVAVLLGTTGSFLVTQQQDIVTEGAIAPSVFFDGTQLTGTTFDVPADSFSDGKLVYGETESFQHTISSPASDGDWEVMWNTYANMDWFDSPTSPYYGYYFNVTNTEGANISYMTVMHGETKTINFVHSLDRHFQATADPIPFVLTLSVVPFVQPPEANPDVFTVQFQNTMSLTPLSNDVSHADDPTLRIISVSACVNSGNTATISPDGQTISYHQGSTTGENLQYTIMDSGPMHKVATSTIGIGVSY